MSNTKRTREALLENSIAALQSGRGAVSGVASQSGVVWLPVLEIAPDPGQPRTHFDQQRMNQLVESLRAIGQTEPILVQVLTPDEQPTLGGRRYRCLSGHRRLRAHEILGLHEIKCVIVRDALPPNRRLVQEIASNEVREDHTDFDRALFMSALFADCLGLEREAPGSNPGASTIEAVKQNINRVFNEFDRTGAFSPASLAIVEACETALKAIGERRNLRWFHRWGSTLLALDGAAREAALAGLDARRVLTLSQVSPRAGSVGGTERETREDILKALYLDERVRTLSHRDLSALVKDINAHISNGTFGPGSVEAILQRLQPQDDVSQDPSAEPSDEGRRSGSRRASGLNKKSKIVAKTNNSISFAERAQAVAECWAYAPAAGRSKRVDIAAQIVRLSEHSPRRADRLLRALEAADHDLRLWMNESE